MRPYDFFLASGTSTIRKKPRKVAMSTCKPDADTRTNDNQELPPTYDHPIELEEDDVCPHCFMTVCVAQANNGAPWLGEGQLPSEHNPPIRKQLYRRFWKIVSNNGGWNIAPYVAKKQRLGGNRPDIVYHEREIMPDCILDLVRSLYPNPKGQPYMGHQWE